MSQTIETRQDAILQTRAHLESIVELAEALKTAQAEREAMLEGETLDLDEIEERAHEYPLSILVRSDWVSPGSRFAAAEYEILLCTGGPAVRVCGQLSEHGEAESVRVEYQDWYIPWQRLDIDSKESEALYHFVLLFWFGE